MNALCVDDEAQALERVMEQCLQLGSLDQVTGFSSPLEALAWLETHPVDVALLDIHMPELSGIQLAERLREMQPEASIVFVTAHPQHALQAIQLRATGYLIKPVSLEELRNEVDYALSRRPPVPSGRVTVHTFGNFDIQVDGKALAFPRAKCKELLAYLVDRQGAGVSRREAFSILWEDTPYDHPRQKQLDVVIRALRATLEANGIQRIFELKNGAMRVFPDRIDCDLYRFLKGDPEAVNAYRGEYMSNYSWGSLREPGIESLRTKEENQDAK